MKRKSLEESIQEMISVWFIWHRKQSHGTFKFKCYDRPVKSQSPAGPVESTPTQNDWLVSSMRAKFVATYCSQINLHQTRDRSTAIAISVAKNRRTLGPGTNSAIRKIEIQLSLNWTNLKSDIVWLPAWKIILSKCAWFSLLLSVHRPPNAHQ